jgi:hypothetical protein
MTRLLRDPAFTPMPGRTVRVVFHRDIREIDTQTKDAHIGLLIFMWPSEDEWERLVCERSAVNL